MLRILALIDEAARVCLALEVDIPMTGPKVSAALDRTALFRGLQKEMQTDSGSKFTENVLIAWLDANDY